MENRRGLFAAMVTLTLFLGLFSPTLVSASAPTQLPATGQISPFYGLGEDSDLQKGTAWPYPRFFEIGDGTVQDNLTGLIWAQDAGTSGGNGCTAGARTWQEALDYVACLNSNAYFGYTDWVLPNINELKSLLSLENFNPALPATPPFTAVHSGFYWTATTTVSDQSRAWIVDLSDGYLASDPSKTIWDYYVLPLRTTRGTGLINLAGTGQTTSYAGGDDGDLERGVAVTLPRYIDNSNGTVTDTLTELVWGKDANTAGPDTCAVLEPGIDKRWTEALDFVACLNDNNYLGYGDWRLPNYNELTSLIDYSQAYPSLNTTHPFSVLAASFFWTSTIYALDISQAWLVNIDSGEVLPGDTVSEVYAVWPVRDAIWSLTVNQTDNGNVTPDVGTLAWAGNTGTATYEHNTVVTLTATADFGNSFSSWGGGCSGNGTCAVTMDAAKSVTATFTDAIAPTVTTFSLPAASNSLSVAISFTASDTVGVTGYCLAETNSSSGCSWSASAQPSYLFTTAGSKTLYAFAKDAAGNISGSASASTTIDMVDPTVTAFTLPAMSSSLTVTISSFTASDNVSVTSYCLTETDNRSSCTWNPSAPTNYLFATAGSKILYAFAKDAAENISGSASANTTIDTTAPTVTAFTLPAMSNSLSVPISSFTANDNIAVTSYCLTETDNSSSCTWNPSAPTNYPFATDGNKNLYAFVQDAAGNISGSATASTTIDTTAPSVTAFTIPTASNSLTVAISSFIASDTVGVTEYCLAETNSNSGCTWNASAPTSYLFVTAGSKTLYAFARDAVGNISGSASASTTIDMVAPTVTAFTLPATSNSLSVAISSFIASDTVGVTGYCLVEINSSSGCTWNPSAPTNYLFASAGSKTLYAFAKDATGNISGSANASTTIDTTAPAVTAFTLPATSNSRTVAISTFTASDTVGVTGYCLVETNSSSGCTWSATAPTSYPFATDGSKNLYAFARDAAGNISNSASASTTIDTTAPAVTAFTIPAASNSLTVTINTFTASDTVGVTGYCLVEINSSSGCTWNSSVPTIYPFATAGNKTIYSFAKDAVGNISASASASTTIDMIAPTVTAFTLPATSSSLTVAINSFIASDTVGVTGYCLVETNSSSGCSWNASALTSYLFTSTGNKNLYAFAKDAAGNISGSASASTTIDTTAPTVTAFILPTTSNSLSVAISSFIASDTVGVTGYCLAETNSSSGCTWSASVPTNYPFTSAGSKTLYAFAKDAVGNISASAPASTTIDTTAPTVTVFTLPATSNSLSVAISSFIASDTVGVTGYCLVETNSSSGCSWSASGPTSYLFTNTGNKNLYAFVRDAAGNISNSASASTTIDTTAPIVTVFTLPTTSNSLTVAISSFIASDTVGVTGYCLAETNSSSGCTWSASTPTSYLFASDGNKNLYAFTRDAVGNISGSATASTTIDTTAPTVTAFTLPLTSNSLSVAISSFIASDTVGVTGYCLVETNSSSGCSWDSSAPTIYPFVTDGSKALYAFARDAVGNISGSASASITIDMVAPTVTAFTLPATSNSLTVAISSFIVSDTVGVTGYCLTETDDNNSCTWSASIPTSYLFASSGSQTLYAFARDAAGNISGSASASTTIDTTVPTVTAFTLPTTSNSLTVAISSFTASDNLGVSGYCLTETDNNNSCIWSASAPANYLFVSAGSQTLFAFARDAVGNISSSLSATTTIDISAPTVTNFTLPATSNSLTVAISSFIASDNMGVTNYCLTEINNKSSCTWSASAPSSYLFASDGNKILYAFAQDAVGNISNSASSSTMVDSTSPIVMAFTLPATSNSLIVPISSLTTNSGGGVSGYCLAETNSNSSCTWSASAPASYTFASAGSKTLYVFAKDAVGNSSESLSASTSIDLVAPTVIALTLPATSSSLNVAISTFTASDAIGVTGYCLTETNSSNGCLWSASALLSYHFAAEGSVNLYAFARDAAGNISASSTASTTITLPDIIAPTVTAFTLPATSNTLIVAISSFNASDVIGVTDYCLVETNSSSGCNWSGSAPANYTFASVGNKTLYAFAEDAAGNISASLNASTTINDVIAPTVNAFTLPATSNSLSVVISSFTASDSVGVTGYCLTETNSSSGCAWPASVPLNYSFASDGTKVLYAFARDAAGNISGSASASTTIDSTSPIVTAFTIPATGNSLSVAINSFNASDSAGVTGYCLVETNSSSSCTWSASVPANYLFANAGDKTLYAFARDSLGNISGSASAMTAIDTIAPTVTTLSLPVTSNSLTVAISNFMASDNVGVTGYCLMATNSSSGCIWSASAPTSYLFTSTGNKNLYAFAKDAAGNISNSAGTSTTIDTTAPSVTAFTLPATSNSLTVSINSFIASDTVGVTDYCLTETNSSNDCSWSASAPTSYLFISAGSQTLYAFAKDATGNISASVNASTTIDTTAPTVTAFTLPATTNSLSVAINSFIASDNIAVTGYCLAQTNSSSGCSWNASAPTNYPFATAGSKTLYAFAKDATGNISASVNASTTIDTTAPTVTAFTLPATTNSLSVAINSFIAGDNIAVTGYCLAQTNSSSDCTWNSTAPTSYLFTTAGSKTLYAFARDAAGNLSASATASITIDTTAPIVTAFTLPATSNSLTVAISSFIASDTVGTEYCLVETNNSSGCTWSASAPTSYPFASAGSKTLYAFAKDATGNLSASATASTTIDMVAPTITAFTLPAMSNSLSVAISSFIAGDTVGVTGYCLTETNSSNDCTWSASAPTSYLFTSAGSQTLYAFAKDAVGNISASAGASTTIDMVAPTVTAFTLPATSNSLTVSISSFIASDTVGTEYCLTETNNSSGCTWSASAPTSYLFASAGSQTLYAFAKDAVGNISGSLNASTTIDTTAPTVTAFTLPATSNSLSVAISSFIAGDTVGVTGYCLTETNSSNDCSWSASAPTSYLFTCAGSQTLYAFAKDATGNISGSSSASTTIDMVAPTVTAFTLPAMSNSLSVAISSFIASDNIAVTGYCLAQTNSSSDCTWNSTAPTSYLFTTAGSKTLYAFARDATGNLSASAGASTTIDTTAPIVTAFTLPATSNSLTVAISSFIAGDTVGVTGYCLAETNSSSGCSWNSSAPTSYLFASAGSQTLYAFAKDAVGNISGSLNASTTIDTTAPTVTAFTLPTTSNSLSVAISSFIASDTVGVTGYCLAETNSSSGCSWNASVPTSYLFASAGSQTLYAFAKDAVGNISGSATASTTIDTTAPTVTAFTLPATTNSLSVAISSFIASDTVSVTGYCLAETNSSSGCTWNSSAPTSYSFTSAGNKNLYAFAKDAAGNLSASATASTTIDMVAPTVIAFTLPATSNSLSVAISSFIASDNIGVTGYCLAQTNSNTGCSWSASAPTSYIFTTTGNNTLYAFAKDAAGNISGSLNASTTIDTTAPTVTAFTLPATSNSLTVTISSFIASDTVGTEYCLVETNNSIGCSWSAWAPTSYLFASAGSQTLYAFAKDAVGNISGSLNASTTIDTTAPSVTALTLPATSNSLVVPIRSFIASDTVGVTGYCLIETSSSSGCTWRASAPTIYLFTTPGDKTLYAFAKDAVGNISGSASANTTIDIAAPSVTTLTLPAMSSSLTVALSFIASDNVAVTSYCLTETDNRSSCSWSVSAPSSYLFTSAGSKNLYVFVKDAAGNISGSASASTTIDTIAPTVTAFTLPATSSSLSVAISFTASDTVGVTGYCLVQTNDNSGCVWSAPAQTSYLFATAGSQTLYAFAQDAAGNISGSASASTTITDISAPSVTFILPGTSNNLTVTISSFSASDEFGVTGYCLAETDSSSGCVWLPLAPTSHSFITEGSQTLYAFAQDAAGNISNSAGASTTIDTIAPTVTVFTLSAASSSLNVDISFTVSDNIGVTGYCLAETDSSSGCVWLPSAPTSYLFASEGSQTLYAFARDALGNISNSAGASTTIDTTAPSVTAFTLPATSSSLSVAIITFTASDTVGVTGYCLAETDSSGCTWSASAPTSYLFASEGSKTLYAFAMDAAENISISKSASVTITLPDTTAPSTPTVVLTTDSGSSNSDLITKDGSLTPGGIEADASVTYSSDGGTTWSSGFIAGEGTNNVQVRQTDVAGNSSGVGSLSFTLDTTAPSSTIVVADVALSAGETSLVTITFNEAVTGFSNTDLTIANGTLSPVATTDSGITWTATFTPAINTTVATNQITLANTGLSDVAGNNGLGSTDSNNYAIDTDSPLVPTVALTTDSGSSNSDLITNDGSLSTGGNEAGATVAYSSDGGTTWSPGFIAGEGTNSVQVRQTDVAGNSSGVGTLSFTLDTTAPTSTISVADSTLISGETTTVTIVFSEVVNGFGLADLTAANGVLSNLVQSGTDPKVYTATLTPMVTTENASNAVSLATTYADVAGNTGMAATSNDYAVDTAAPATPTVALIKDSGSSNSDLITNDGLLTPGGIEADASVTYSSDGGTTWSPDFSAAEGINSVQIRQTDVAGNTSTASGVYSFTLDMVTPTVAITLPTASISLTVVISSFTASDSAGVTGYCLSETNSSSGCTWSASAPTSYPFTSAGSKTLYAFAQDAAGNISASSSATTTIITTYGDLNNDNETTAADALLALQMAIGKKPVDTKADIAPLINNIPVPNGKVTAADVLVILCKAVGLW